MAQVTQTRRWEQFDLDYERLSSQYFSFGALITALRIIWVIARTSGVFGTPPNTYLKSFENGLGIAFWIYTALGFVGLIYVLYKRSHSEENISSTRLIINFVGVLILLIAANRITSVVRAEEYPFTLWGLQFVNGMVLGGVYALVALGYTLVYGILFMINFAHGEVLVMGTFGGWFALAYVTELGGGTFEVGAAAIAAVLLPLLFALLFLPLEALSSRMGRKPEASPEASTTWIITMFMLPIRMIAGALLGYGLLQALGGYAPQLYDALTTVLALIFIIAVGMITSMLVAIAVERIAYRPLRRAPRLTPLISAIGTSFFLQQAMYNVFGPLQRFYRRPKLIDGTISVEIGNLGAVPVTKTGIVIVIVALIMMVSLYLFVQRSKTGRAMRAVAEDKQTAALMGVNVDQVIVTTFALGAVLAGAAGVMMGFHNLAFDFRSGFIPGLKAFTAAVLGGIGNIAGAMFGGFFLGFVEAFGPTMLGIPTEYKDVIAFGLLILILIFRPTGIFGEVLAEKKV